MHSVASHALSFFTPVAAPELSTAPGGHGDVTGDDTSVLQSDETSLHLLGVVYILPPECVGKQRRKQTAILAIRQNVTQRIPSPGVFCSYVFSFCVSARVN